MMKPTSWSAFMACHCAFPFSPSPQRDSLSMTNTSVKPSRTFKPLVPSSFGSPEVSYNALVFEAARLLGPPAKFDASKLKVVLMGEDTDTCTGIIPRVYTLSHCDFTANLTLTISNIISLDQLKGWYNKDDVVAEWKEVKGEKCLHVHCYLSGPNLLLDLAAEFRYHIFSKELPLVLKAVLHGDSVLFREHPELTDAIVRVYFHSSSHKYNCIECWGPLKDAAQGGQVDQIHGVLTAGEEGCRPQKRGNSRSIFQALFAFLL